MHLWDNAYGSVLLLKLLAVGVEPPIRSALYARYDRVINLILPMAQETIEHRGMPTLDNM